MSDDLQERTKKIQEIYDKAVADILELEKKQRKIVNDFVAELEKRKIEELQNKLKS